MSEVKIKELDNVKYQQIDNIGYVRVLHAVPNAPAVDIYANDNILIKNLEFGGLTKYIPIPEGSYKISIYATGDTKNPVIEAILDVVKNKIITVAAIGMLEDIDLIGIYDTAENNSEENAMVRFIHLSPNAPAVDITLPDGTVLFENVAYMGITPYISVPEGEYTLQVRPTGTDTVVLTVPDVELEGGNVYSVYALGLVGETPALRALLAQDGITKTNY